MPEIESGSRRRLTIYHLKNIIKKAADYFIKNADFFNFMKGFLYLNSINSERENHSIITGGRMK